MKLKLGDYAKDLDKVDAPKSQIGLQFVQIGESNDVWERLKELDDKIFKENGTRSANFSASNPEGRLTIVNSRDIVDARQYNPSAPNNDDLVLRQIMLGANHKSYDEEE